MSRVWISDLWVKNASATLPDGTVTTIQPTRAQMRSLKKLPEHFRTKRFMRGNRWRVAWHEHTPNGVKERTRSFTTRTSAEAFAAELEDDIRSGRYIDPAGQNRLFKDVAEEWLASKKKIKDSTYYRYRRELDTYVLPQWHNTRIGQITRKRIDAWITALQEGNAPHAFTKQQRPRLNATSIQHLVTATFGAVIRYAIDTEIIARSPLNGVELPRLNSAEVADLPVFSVEQIELIAAHAQRVTDRAQKYSSSPVASGTLIRLLAYTGLRVSEALALQAEDIDYANARIHVKRTWTTGRTGSQKLGVPKTYGRRQVPIPQFLAPALQELTTGKDAREFVFTGARGTHIVYKNWYNRVWRKTLLELSITGHSVHSLRHTAASLAIMAGADVKVVQQMLGHKDATETLNTYSHLWPDRLDEVMDALTEYRSAVVA